MISVLNRGGRRIRFLPLGCGAIAGLFLSSVTGAADSEGIAAAQKYSEQEGGQALVVLRQGRVVHESYAGSGGPTRPVRVMSITKNLVAVAGFAAAGEGWLDLDEPISRTIPEWTGRRGGIVLRQLLDQTSGLSPGNSTIYGRGVRDKVAAALRLDVVSEPGRQFDYGAGNFEVFGEVLRRKLAARGIGSVPEFLANKVLRPVGAEVADWDLDPEGAPYYSTGASMTAVDLARFGELVRTRGRAWIWPIIPEINFDAARRGSEANSMYGLSFWLNRNARNLGAEPTSVEGTLGDERSPEHWGRSSLSAVAPTDLIAMIGSGGIRCYVVPTEKLVVVRFGSGRGFSDAAFLAALFGG